MNGFINVLKPPGITSSDVVAKLKRLVRPDKIGHMGTLDPAAAGVLPIAVGKAARLFDFLLDKKKIYRAWFTFGSTTDTLDSCGAVTERKQAEFSREQLLNAVRALTGEIDQIPPQYSAVNIAGRRAYDLARSGVEFSIAPKRVIVYEIKLLQALPNNTYLFDITVSGGTYIRSLVRDLAQILGTVGYMSALIRLSAGAFKIENAFTMQEAEEISRVLIPAEEVLLDVPRIDLSDALYDKLANGVKIRQESLPDGLFRVYARGEFFGLARRNENGYLEIEVYLRG